MTSFAGSPDFSNGWGIFDPVRVLAADNDTVNTLAYNALVKYANVTTATLIVGSQDNIGSRVALASALVGLREDDATRMNLASTLLLSAIGSEHDGGQRDVLSWSRNMVGVVVAWDFVKRAGPLLSAPVAQSVAQIVTLNAWIEKMFDENYRATRGDRRSIMEAAEQRADDTGSHARAAMAAGSVYFQTPGQFARIAGSFVSWAGEYWSATDQYAKLTWNPNPAYQIEEQVKYGIMAPSLVYSNTATHPASGAMPEQLVQDNSTSYCYVTTGNKSQFHWHPPETPANYEGLQGAVICAQILGSHGYPTVWTWMDSALKRAYQFINEYTRSCTYSAGEDGSDTSGELPVGINGPMGRILNDTYGLSYATSGYTAMRSIVGLDWYLTV